MGQFKAEYFPDTQEELVEMSDDLLLEALKEGYQADPIPPCRVCGGQLDMVSCGGGEATKWACTMYEDDPTSPGEVRVKADRTTADEHYSQSQHIQYNGGDRRVLELVRRFRVKYGTN